MRILQYALQSCMTAIVWSLVHFQFLQACDNTN